MFIDAKGAFLALRQEGRPRSGDLSIVCAHRNTPGRVAVTCVRPEPIYKGNR
jgi:hypothetical protein